jgi:hypothetical protein
MPSAADESAQLAEIRRLTDLYAVGMDTGALDVFPRLFVPDGALIVRAPGREKPLGTFQGPGPDGIGLIAKLLRELYRATLHNITTHVASIDGDRATGTTYCLAYHMADGDGDGDGGTLETLGVRYEEQLIRTEEGWRFTVRDATRLWSQITPTPFQPLLIDRAAARARSAS